MTKRLLALLLAAVLTVAMAACTGNSGGTGAGDPAEESPDAAEEDEIPAPADDNVPAGEAPPPGGEVPDAEGATITLWMPPFASEGETTDKEFWTSHMQDAADAANASLTIETVPWDNYEEKYLTGVASGTGPDIGYMYNEMLRNYVDMEALEPLEGYFTQEEIDNYLYWDKGQVDGVQYTLPFVVGAPRILFCNMDLLGDAGYDAPPTTWEELEEISLAIAEATGKVGFQQYWGGYFGDLNEIFFPYLWQAGGEIYDAGGQLAINSEAGVKAATWLYSLKEQGILTESSTSMDAGAVRDEFMAGNVAMYVSSSTSARRFTEAGMNWDYVPYLTETRGATCSVADCLVLLSGSKQKEVAAYLMKDMTKASTMEDFHRDLYSMPPISKGEAYLDDPRFESMYTDYADGFYTLPVVSNASQVYATLFSNLQLMMMGNLTPQEALDNTVAYAESMS